MKTWPRSGRSNPTRRLRKTDLPVPDGPSSTEISPLGSVSETFSQMTWRPKDLLSPSTVISTPTQRLPFLPPYGTTRRGAMRNATSRMQVPCDRGHRRLLGVVPAGHHGLAYPMVRPSTRQAAHPHRVSRLRLM